MVGEAGAPGAPVTNPTPEVTTPDASAGMTGAEKGQIAGGVAAGVGTLLVAGIGAAGTVATGADRRAAVIEGERAKSNAAATERSMNMAVQSRNLGQVEDTQLYAAMGANVTAEGSSAEGSQSDGNLAQDRPTGTPNERNFA